MKKHFLELSILLLILSWGINAQNLDTVPKKQIYIDKDYLAIIQMLSPEFFYTTDSLVFSKNIQKYLLEPFIVSENNFKKAIAKDSSVLIKRDKFLELAEALFWQRLLSVHIMDSITALSDTQIKDYYDKNQDAFKTPLKFSFWQLWITEDREDLQKKAVLKLKEFTKILPDENKRYPKYSENGFSINFEMETEVSKNNNLYDFLVSSKLMEISGPYKIGKSTIYLFTKSKIGGDLIPFDQVKNICKNALLNQKLIEYEKQKQEYINTRFNIIISDDLKNIENQK